MTSTNTEYSTGKNASFTFEESFLPVLYSVFVLLIQICKSRDYAAFDNFDTSN